MTLSDPKRSDSFQYDALGNRFGAAQVASRGPNTSTADRLYVHGGRVDEIVASKVAGQWYHHHYDARGHCTLLTDSGGAIRDQYDYDAFGMPYFYNAAGTSLGNSSDREPLFVYGPGMAQRTAG